MGDSAGFKYHAGERPIVLQSDGSTSLNSHGRGYAQDECAYTLNNIDRQSVAFAQNQRGEVRLEGL